jgi:acetyl esterase/lipase
MIHVEAFDIPRSSPLVARPGRGVAPRTEAQKATSGGSSPPIAAPPGHDDTNAEAVRAYRNWADVEFYPRAIAKIRERYPVTIQAREIAGVYTEIISPEAGVASANKGRVLINLHAGGFTFGARLCGQLESIPIASTAGIDVISVDYRLAPEHRHPAAVEDVIAVYRELLKSYDPRNIGIFGSSAGALLTAQAIFRMVKDNLPTPGAVAMLFAGATYWGEGDSAKWAAAIHGRTNIPDPKEHLYFQDVEDEDATAFPLYSPETLAHFPPSLLVSGGRDIALSSVIHTHARLTASGVPAQLNIWEGVGHAFSLDFRLPQSEELYATLVRFFGQNLGREGLTGEQGNRQ